MSLKTKKSNVEKPTEQESDKNQAFDVALSNIEKQFGKGSLIRLGSNEVAKIHAIRSGSLLIDRAIGIGGYPRGRIVEIYGPESSGKTTLALHAIAEAQKSGGRAAFVDAEHAIDPVYAKNLGVDTDNLWISQPDNGEQALEITEHLIRSGAVDIVVIDSVAALTPKSEIAGLMADTQVALQARLMSKALRKLAGIISKTSTCLIFINQIRMKIGTMFGNPETTTGGNALKFYASVRLDVRRIDRIQQGTDTYIGNKTRVKVVKNKVAPPFRNAEFNIYYGKGISAHENVLELAVEKDLIKKSGSWYSYKDEKIGQGKENAVEFLEKNANIFSELEALLIKDIFPNAELLTKEEKSTLHTQKDTVENASTSAIGSKEAFQEQTKSSVQTEIKELIEDTDEDLVI